MRANVLVAWLSCVAAQLIAPGRVLAARRVLRVRAARPPSSDALVQSTPQTVDPEAERGTYVGPMYVDGKLAKHLRRLPSKMRRGMAAPVGPTVMKIDRSNVASVNVGLGMYVRF